MVTQYPHYLYVHVVGAATQDDEGNWTNTADNWNLHSMCREETNGRGSVINGADGRAVVYSSVIYLPKSAGEVQAGTEIVVSQFNDVEDGVRIKARVIKCDTGQLNKRIWV